MFCWFMPDSNFVIVCVPIKTCFVHLQKRMVITLLCNGINRKHIKSKKTRFIYSYIVDKKNNCLFLDINTFIVVNILKLFS